MERILLFGSRQELPNHYAILVQIERGSHMAAPAYPAGLTQQAQNVQVCCRVRPERNDASVVDLRCAGREVQLHKIEGVCEEAVYTFDKVFSPTSPQREVYEQSARPVIEAILQGFNAKKRLTLS